MIDNVNHPRHYGRGPFECINLTWAANKHDN